MSLDVLDLSVVHLSAYERLQRRWRRFIPTGQLTGLKVLKFIPILHVLFLLLLLCCVPGA
jgi:hypothetical protein